MLRIPDVDGNDKGKVRSIRNTKLGMRYGGESDKVTMNRRGDD